MRMFKSAVKVNPIVGSQGFLLYDFIDPLIFTLGCIDQLPFFYGEDRTFGVDFGCCSPIKPVDGATIGNPVRSDDGAMGWGKALAYDTAKQQINTLPLAPTRPFI